MSARSSSALQGARRALAPGPCSSLTARATLATAASPTAVSSARTASLQQVAAETAALLASQAAASDSARQWLLRLDRLANLADRPGRRIAVVGSTLAGTASLLPTLLDEPLRDAASGDERTGIWRRETLAQLQSRTQAAFLHAASINKSPQEHVLRIVNAGSSGAAHDASGSQLLTAAHDRATEHSLRLPIPWISEENSRSASLELIEILDPSLSSCTLAALYEADQIFFVLDAQTLIKAARGRSAREENGTLELLRYFADKSGVHVLVNRTGGGGGAALSQNSAQELVRIVLGRSEKAEAEAGARSSSSPSASSTTVIDVEAAVRANAALRRAISPLPSSTSPSDGLQSSAALWDQFTTLYEASSLGSVRALLAALSSPTAAQTDLAARREATSFALSHAISDALALVARRQDRLEAVRGAMGLLEEEVEGLARRMIDEALEAGKVRSASAASDAEESRPGRVLTPVAVKHSAVEVQPILEDPLDERQDNKERSSLASFASSVLRVVRSDPVLSSDRSASPASQATDARHVLPSLTERRPGPVEEAFRSRLSLWKLVLLGRSDEVALTLEQAVSRSFAKEEEEKLIFQAGRLHHLATNAVERTDNLLTGSLTSRRAARDMRASAESALSEILSPTQLNALRLGLPTHHSHRYALNDPYILARPIGKRRAQLLGARGSSPLAASAAAPAGGEDSRRAARASVIDTLAARVQSAVVRTYVALVPAGILAGGPFLSRFLLGVGSGPEARSRAVVASVEGSQTGAGAGPGAAATEALEYLASLEPGTALPLSALLALFSIYTLQTSWTKAKRTFWKEWDALAHNLAADVQGNAEDVVREHVGAYPRLVRAELARWAEEEGAEVGELRDRVLKVRQLLEIVAGDTAGRAGTAVGSDDSAKRSPETSASRAR
ncbi:hypothetical protein OC835_003690 [Tilletia horrida]|nr:hypothetical protein OC835_003690 [Tilletia horrida]